MRPVLAAAILLVLLPFGGPVLGQGASEQPDEVTQTLPFESIVEPEDSEAWRSETGREQTWLQYSYEYQTSSSSGSGHQALIETVVERTPEGLVLEYDWPQDKQGNPSSNYWYFPARLLKHTDGSLVLLDEPAIERRIDRWLGKYKFPRDACGRWSHGGGFPFKIDCDPQSIIEQIELFDVRFPGIVAGGFFEHPLGQAPGMLIRNSSDPLVMETMFALDPEKAREQEVEQKLIIAQMMGEPLSREEAVAEAARIKFAGRFFVTFKLNAAGEITKVTRLSETTVAPPDTQPETKTRVEVLERFASEPELDPTSLLERETIAR